MNSVTEGFYQLNDTDDLSSHLMRSRKASVISNKEHSDNSNHTDELPGSNIDSLRPFADFELLSPTLEDLREMSNELEENGALVNGWPSHLNDIMMLECPFYQCSAATIVSRHIRRNTRSDNNKKQNMRETQMSSLAPEDKINFAINSTEDDETSEKSIIRESLKKEKDVIKEEIEEEQAELGNKLKINVIDSIVMTVLQIINCIIKYTLVQIAFCFKVLGLEYGVAAIGIIALLSIISVHMLISVHMITKQNNYLAFSERMFGQWGKLLLLILNFFSAYGSCLSYIIIFLKIVPSVIRINLCVEWISNDVYLHLPRCRLNVLLLSPGRLWNKKSSLLGFYRDNSFLPSHYRRFPLHSIHWSRFAR